MWYDVKLASMLVALRLGASGKSDARSGKRLRDSAS
jgi:hypothetical protein